MKKILIATLFLSIFNFGLAEEDMKQQNLNEQSQKIESKKQVLNTRAIYDNLGLKGKIDYVLFQKAYLGYVQITNKNPGILIIIDYTKPSNLERFYVIDFSKNKLVYSSRVAHSKNSGLEVPLQFSDDPNSYQSSLGFFLTMGEYEGAYGHSLRLKGLEENINGNAEERAIVIHGGEIVEDSYIKKYGFAGRSLGCPVLPYSKSKEIIDYIKNGRVLFVYGNDEDYMDNSTYLSQLAPLFEGQPKNTIEYEIPSQKQEENSSANKIVAQEVKETVRVIRRTEMKKETPIFEATTEIDNPTVMRNLARASLIKKDLPQVESINSDMKQEENKNIEIKNKIEENVSNKKINFSREVIKKSLGLGIKNKKK